MDFSAIKDLYIGSTPVQSAWLNGSKVWGRNPAVLENQPPSIHTAALYEEINETHAGTLEDPIPYNNNMALEEGKYYSQDGVTYLCTNSTGQAVYNNLSDLVGIYVEVMSDEEESFTL